MLTRAQSIALYTAAISSAITAFVLGGSIVANPCRPTPAPPTHPVPAAQPAPTPQ